MRIGLPHIANRTVRLAILPIASLALWSCSTAGSDVYDTTPAYSAAAKAEQANSAVAAANAEANGLAAASAPENEPGETVMATAAAIPTPVSGDRPADLEDDASAPVNAAEKPSEAAQAEAAKGEKKATASASEVDAANAGDGSVATAASPDASAKKTGLFAFLGSKPRATTQAATRDGNGAPAAKTPEKRSQVAEAASPKVEKETTARAAPQLNMASLEMPGQSARSAASDNGALPGVRQSALFEIKRRSGIDDDSDVDLYEDAPPVQFASVGGMARMSPNGLLKQHDSVDVSCFKPALVRMLKQIEGRFGRKLVVTSGYRNPMHNRKVRGAKNSQHMYCAAADIQVEGVSKWDLAKYVRTLPGRGGVGTYCHTESVHVDIGPERDWNWRCRGRRKA